MAYSPEEIKESFDRIINFIEEGNSLRAALQLHDTPASELFYKWLEEDEEKSKRYARACEVRADKIVDDIIEISDNSNGDYAGVSEDGKLIVDGSAIQRDRLRVDARKWLASKLAPKKYGNKVDVTSGGEKLQQQVISVDPLSDD